MNDIYQIMGIGVVPDSDSDFVYLDRKVELPEQCVGDHNGIIITQIDGDKVYIKRGHGLRYGMQIAIRPLTIQALRYNEGKPKWHLVHFPSLEPMVEVLEYGCKKYDQDNWKKPMDKKQILESAMRHLIKLMGGEEIDAESGLQHHAHVSANMMFYSYHSNQK